VLIPEFEESVGFRYRTAAGERAVDDPAAPDWRAVAFAGEDA
jgi:hypothetical protein